MAIVALIRLGKSLPLDLAFGVELDLKPKFYDGSRAYPRNVISPIITPTFVHA